MLFMILWLMYAGCSSSGTNDDGQKITLDTLNVSLLYKNKIFNLPGPQYANHIIDELDLHFNPDFPNKYSRAENYNSSVKKALNLGIYGTDLGYLNVFSMVQESTPYLNSLKNLTRELEMHDSKIHQNFIKIERNIAEPDSLLYYLAEAYLFAGKYLQDNQRSDIASLVLAGSWIESLYFLTCYFEETGNFALYKYIGEQKYPLENLIQLLAPYYNKNDEITMIIDMFVDLAYEFDIIDFSYDYSSVTHDTILAKTIVTSETNMHVSTGTLKNIISKAKLIRNEIVN